MLQSVCAGLCKKDSSSGVYTKVVAGCSIGAGLSSLCSPSSVVVLWGMTDSLQQHGIDGLYDDTTDGEHDTHRTENVVCCVGFAYDPIAIFQQVGQLVRSFSLLPRWRHFVVF